MVEEFLYKNAVAVIGDVHIGKKRVNKDDGMMAAYMALEALSDAYAFCKKHKIVTLVVNGDLFHYPIVEPEFVDRVRSIIDLDVETIILAGNHDYNSRNDSLKYLTGLGNVELRDYSSVAYCGSTYALQDDITDSIAVVPYVRGSSALAEIDIILDDIKKNKVKLLIGHFGIYGSNHCPEWMAKDPWFVSSDVLAESLTGSSVSCVITGHRHDYYFDAVNTNRKTLFFYNIGAACPVSFSDVGLNYGNIAVIERFGSKPKTKVFKNELKGLRFFKDSFEVDDHYFSIVSSGKSFRNKVFNFSEDVSELFGKVFFIDKKEENGIESVDCFLDNFSLRESLFNYVEDNYDFESNDLVRISNHLLDVDVLSKKDLDSLLKNKNIRRHFIMNRRY